MALFPLIDLLQGTKRIFTGLQAQKSDTTMETLKTNDAGALKVEGTMQFSGSIPEYGWLSTDDEPTPDDPTKMAFGIVIDVSTDTMSTKYWNGSLWRELI